MKYGQMDRAWRYGREKQDGVESSGKKETKTKGTRRNLGKEN